MLIPPKRSRRKPDPFLVLVVMVALGVCVTIGYQVVLYSGASEIPIATQAPAPAKVGG